MINLQKQIEFLDPAIIDDSLHIIGCGAIGSHVAEALARLGFTNIHLYDFDTVEPKNIANQNYFNDQIGKPKTEALAETLKRINDSIEITIHNKGWNENMILTGYVFLCPDKISVRQSVVENCIGKKYVKGIFDFRMRLTDAQHYAGLFDPDYNDFNRLLKTMQFTDEEAKEATPVSACGSTLSVITTIKIIVSYGISNFLNAIKNQPVKHVILIDAFQPDMTAF